MPLTISTIAVSPSDPNQVIFGTSNGAVYRSTAAVSGNNTTVWVASKARATIKSKRR